MNNVKSKGTLLAALGPGILFAAAAVGVSHLVQATRAGAMFGPGMISIIIIACLLKYPAIRFGSDYTAATGRSLIQSYRQSGLWILVLYGIAQVFSMFFIVAAVSLVTASLLKATLNIEINDLLLVAGLLFVVGNDEGMKRKGIEVVRVVDLGVKDLAPNGVVGRLVCYSEAAIKDIEGRFK